MNDFCEARKLEEIQKAQFQTGSVLCRINHSIDS